ncbi:hypothetical protein SAMN05444162_2972 [Paenibacillaceae bacterium GAS479]|nr:hypothetical protein SAMN05444162_2972 [Paenibacillaceae bacterium GAS479]
MRKYRVFIITTLITTSIVGICAFLFIFFFGVKESYQLSSEVSFSNQKGIIKGYLIDFNDFKNKDGNFQLQIGLGSNEDREIDFEISSLINYEQKKFRIIESNSEMTSSILSVRKNKKSVTIIIDKDEFKLYRNKLVLNVRQDIKQLSYKNKLVRDSTTLNFTFYVVNKNGKKQDSEVKKHPGRVVETPLGDDKQTVIFNIVSPLKKGALIKVGKGEDILVNLNIGGNNSRNYLVWAYLNSNQVKINGSPYINFEISENKIGAAELKIENSFQPGVYELELYCVPSPEDITRNLKEVISAKRYTVKVE